ncbi:immunoglobulin-binding protein 1-like isoform X1 [Sturnira hondurensis]|uniref:immunoglobulin-binding protein 1-like isoform X1 n=1 Tax=Sturnira hondurensis TaxID=192404 RepID=UPI00187A346F|nr:immunoglobulin-binding protein 1-like isoform X1 [Sturnira hondurensis]XP_036907582.1 immunoglobulin-binding protein 1-like isoform X1 [Sturnira hondurensis]
MATQEAAPGSQSENSALELPSACDIRDYVLQEASQEAPGETVSSVEALSIPSSSEADPAPSHKMEAAEGEEFLPQRLPELFDSCQRLLDEVGGAAEPAGARVVQEKVLRGLHLLKRSAQMLLQLDLLSPNEDLEEVASSDLKYLMVPALQGALALKQVNPGRRLDQLRWARERFLIYLTQCQHYHVAEFELPKTKNNSAENNTAGCSVAHPDLVAMASQRQAQIERYKRKKEMEHRLSALKAAVESGEAGDEHVREYHLLHLRRWVGISLEEIDSIDQEIEILRGKDAPEQASAPGSTPQSRPPMKPFILTRNAAQAKVFGAGYPSLASMTVSDWYDQRRKVGALPDQGMPKTTSEVRRGAQQHEDQEQKEEEDEEEALQRAREWDDWKDTHPRGSGNRQNMG